MATSAHNARLGLTHGAGHFDPTKAGMAGVSKEKVAQVVDEMSRGSKYYSNAQQRDKQLEDKIASIKQQLERTSASELRSYDDAMNAMCARAEAHDRDLTQVWVVLDMDAFFCACEIREKPELANVPMAVGSIGMISTANYAARKFGVRAAMPGFIAKKLCPQLVFVDHHFHQYTAAAEEVRSVIRKYDPHFSAMSLDEAYICLTPYLIQQGVLPKESSTHPADHQPQQLQTGAGAGEDVPDLRPAKRARTAAGPGRGRPPSPAETSAILAVVQQMRDEVKAVTARYHPPSGTAAAAAVSSAPDSSAAADRAVLPPGVPIIGACDPSASAMAADPVLGQAICLTCSCGIGPNPMLAKIASNDNKPDGQALVPWDRTSILGYMSKLSVRAIPGVGKVTEKLLTEIGLTTCGDVLANKGKLRAAFNERMSSWLLRCCLGIANADRDTAAQHGFFGEKGSNAPQEEGEVGRKSISSERTFRDCNDWETLKNKAIELAQSVAADMSKEGIVGHTATLKMKLHTFEVLQRSATLAKPTADAGVLAQAAESLLQAAWPVTLRLVGFRMSGLSKIGSKPTALQTFLASKATASGSGTNIQCDDEVEVLDSADSAPSGTVVDAVHNNGADGQGTDELLSPQRRALGMAVVAPARHLPHTRAIIDQHGGGRGKLYDITALFAMQAASASRHARSAASGPSGSGSGAAASGLDDEQELLLSQTHESHDDLDIIDLLDEEDDGEGEARADAPSRASAGIAVGAGNDSTQAWSGPAITGTESAPGSIVSSSVARANRLPSAAVSSHHTDGQAGGEREDSSSIEILSSQEGSAVPTRPGQSSSTAAVVSAAATARGTHGQGSGVKATASNRSQTAHAGGASNRGAIHRGQGAIDAFLHRK